MNLVQQIKSQLVQAMKSQNEVEKNILRVVLGEISVVENYASQNGPITEEQIHKIIRKIMLSNAETISYLPENEDRRLKLIQENKILESFLPNQLSISEIRQKLQTISEEIKAAKGGAAVGIAIQYFKQQGISVSGKDVRVVVEEMQS